ncbi:SOS response-associated peptidase family protein [Pontixanthobacter aestiaquae]|uniref:Abasic site processing protein n=2 Tax=Pontixanthobacter aestiaquae TaxID=1509367 RepID=A0A844ZAD0_9SPHN|nr:SOS response-associated peptidase family protein [Pontixanthobacter aestiaquae]MDN3645012.1 SOS response-associated peptidase family protein [Pontixanthobacter aestiaquae]MXO83987.1 hypothetical protein [Pontixanthobacter aestiaquae]
MCNLYKLKNMSREVAATFGARDAAVNSNHGAEVYPGTPGLVVAEGEVRQMNWGFPLALTGKKGRALKPRPVNNARTDKLRGPFWRDSDEWGPCYSMVTTEASAAVEAVHHRMPMILPRDLWPDWTSADTKEGFERCAPWVGQLTIKRTDEG